MLHGLVGYARSHGIDTRWAVIDGTPDFFCLTKRLGIDAEELDLEHAV